MNAPAQAHSSEPFHATPAEAVLVAFGARLAGLDDAEAARRLAQFGANRLTQAAGPSAVRRLLAQFQNALLYVLLAAGAATFLLGHWVDAGVILGVVVINALIGFAQESRAERALQAVRDLLAPQATVRRSDERRTLPADMVVPGDIVLLAPGDRVPADLRLVMTRELRLNEAALTGEAMPADKTPDPVPADAPLAERRSMAYAGCLVAAGQGEGMVVATGDATEIGRIGRLLAEVETLTTPLLRAFAAFGQRLSAVILVLAALVFAFGWLVRGLAAEEMLLAAVGIAVAAIPEGLPAVLTIALAIGVERMARRNAIIRQLPAVETLGAVSVICTDKTGTLTRNEMSVTSVALADATVPVDGTGHAPEGGFDDGPLPLPALDALRELAKAGLLCNEARLVRRDGRLEVDGDPTEGALIVLALRAGLDPAEAVPRLAPPRSLALRRRDAAHGDAPRDGRAERRHLP